MAKFKLAPLSARIGTGIGQGIANNFKEEFDRGRLAAGLKNLSEQKGLSPFQQFSGLASLPGTTPQIIQSGSDILRQQARGQALADFNQQQNQPKPSPFPQRQQGQVPNQPSPSITQQRPLEEIQGEGGIPRNKDQEFERAGELYNQNPARFGNDPQKAIDFVEAETARDIAINQAYEKKHENLSRLQDNVVNRLKAQSDRLGAQSVPAELYSRIEDEAINATRSKALGGEGLTEQQAIKKYGDKLNDAARDYAKINELGGLGVALRPASDSLRSLNQLQKSMKNLDESDNYAKKLISQTKLSPSFAYALAEPVHEVPKLNSFIKNLPQIPFVETLAESRVDLSKAAPETLRIAPTLANFIKDHADASPLAIAYEIEKRGYDGRTFLDYLSQNSNQYNLRQRQSEQVETPLNVVTPWNDWWLSSFTGVK